MKDALRKTALAILDACPDLALATLREDGFPQNTTVSFVHDGLNIYFGTGQEAQKARNMARDPRVSLTLTAPYDGWDDIRGLSMAGHAEAMITEAEIAFIGELMLKKFPQIGEMDLMEGVTPAFFRVTPTVLSVLDYSKGFGHVDTVAVNDSDLAETLSSMQHKWLVSAG